jgi:hypothetical protein
MTSEDLSHLRANSLEAKEYHDYVGTPVYGVYGMEGVSTSRRAEGFGFLDASVAGIPVWALGLGAVALLFLPKLLK